MLLVLLGRRQCCSEALAGLTHRSGDNKRYFLDLCSGLPLRLVEAIFSRSFSLIDEAIDFEAPLS